MRGAPPLDGCCEEVELPGDRRIGGVGIDHPSIRLQSRSDDRLVSVCSHQDGRPRLLEGPGRDRGPLYLTPREINDRLVARPQLLERGEVSLEPLDHALPIDPEGQVLLIPVAEAGPEDEAPAGQHVDGCELLGRGHRIVEGEQVDGNDQRHVTRPVDEAPQHCYLVDPVQPRSSEEMLGNRHSVPSEITCRVGDAQFAVDLGGQVAPESVLVGDHCTEPQRITGTLWGAHQ